MAKKNPSDWFVEINAKGKNTIRMKRTTSSKLSQIYRECEEKIFRISTAIGPHSIPERHYEKIAKVTKDKDEK